MDITEESKALLEEYNKTVSFVLVGLVGVLPQPVLLPLSSHPILPSPSSTPLGTCTVSLLPRSDPRYHLDLRADNASLQAVRAVG